MKIKQIAVALPDNMNTGWGLAGRRITAEMGKKALVNNLVSTGLLQLDEPVEIQGNLLQAIQGANCLPQYPHLAVSRKFGAHVGYCFIENDLQMRRYVQNLPRYFDAVVTGSTWAQNCLEQALIEIRNEDVQVFRAIQGVDGDVFRADPATDPEWFTVFSGGKWEYRKGQDVVIAAMKVMMERHADVRLVASWWNAWPASANSMKASQLIEYAPWGNTNPNADIQVAALKYLPADRIEFVWETPHPAMVDVYRRCDVAIFPNRCEAGTNLPLMEAAACGVPIIATTAHGHADVARAIGFPLGAMPFIYSQNGAEIGSWFEPDLDQAIGRLEEAYSIWKNSGCLMGYPTRAVTEIAKFTWDRCAEDMLAAF